MNSEIFSDKWSDDTDAKMKKNCRQTLLFIDNCPYHLVDVQLHNVKLVLFPTNMTSIAQPLDQDAIHSFKCHCRQIRWNTLLLDAPRPVVLIKPRWWRFMLFDGLMWRGTKLPTPLFPIAFTRLASLVRCLINRLFKMRLCQRKMVAIKIQLNILMIFFRMFALMVTNGRQRKSLISTQISLLLMNGTTIETLLRS